VPSADPRALLITALFVLFMATAAPTVDWLDVGELVSSAWDLGVSHPPGQPLPTLLWKLAMMVPAGCIAWRGALVSVACAAGAVWPLLLIARCSLDALPAPLRPAWPVVLVLPALAGPACWLQAVRAEVYAPQLLLALGVVAASLTCCRARPERRPRAVIAVVALLGLSGATHPLLAVALLPAALAGLILAGPAAWRGAVPGGVAATGATLGLWLYLPLRSAARPELAWGTPHTWPDFLAVLSGRAFAHNFDPADGSMVTHNLGVLLDVAMDDIGPALALLAVAGLAWVARRGPRPVAMILALAVVGNLATVLLQNKVFGTNPDLHGYVALSVALAALLASVAVFAGLAQVLANGRQTLAVVAAWTLAVVLAGSTVLVGLVTDRSRNYHAEALARSHIDGLPTGSVVITSGNTSAFAGWYLERVERRRPDLRVFHRVLLGHPFYEDRLRRRHGDPPGGIDTAALRADGRVALDGAPVVAVEIREPDLAWSDRLLPAGRVMLLAREPLDAQLFWAAHVRRLQRWWPDPDDEVFLRDGEAQQVALYEGLLRASSFQQRGRTDLVEAELALLDAFAPGVVAAEGLPEPAGEAWWRQR